MPVLAVAPPRVDESLSKRTVFESEAAGIGTGVENYNPVHTPMSTSSAGPSSAPEQVRKEETPAYMVLRKHGLLVTEHRLDSHADLDAVPANSSRECNLFWSTFCCLGKMFGFCKTFEVPAGHIKCVTDGRGGFEFRSEGVHLINDPFYSVESESSPYGTGTFVHGDRTLVVVEQGNIGFAMDRGQPVLLPPGLHQWKSPTLIFKQMFDLNNNVIRMGPLTLVTVDSGYAAVTEDNGSQKILDGGETYLLTHRNWKFQKYISTKIQSTTMKRIEATSADNVLMAVDATVIWRINDVDTAARNSAETISKTGGDATNSDLGDIHKLTNDVLKQAEASLAAFIGAVQYSDTFGVAAAAQGDGIVPTVSATALDADNQPAPAPASQHSQGKEDYSSPLFDLAKLDSCVRHANEITKTYGVHIISINVVSAVPADRDLQSALAQGAVAAAEAQKFETVARGRASAATIEAEGIASADVAKARGMAEAEQIRADGARKAADMLAASDVAVKFAMVDKTGAALSDKSTFFFGNEAGKLDAVLTSAIAPVAAGMAGRSA